MRLFLLLLLVSVAAGCAATRVLVRDCQDLRNYGDVKNCELVRKL